jgi:uncharacterized membrane protein
MAESIAPPSRRLLVSLAAVGVLLSVWLWVLHVRTYLAPSASSFCSFDAKFDCVQVAASPYSIFLGIPWAAYGTVGFLALTALLVRRSILALPLALLMGTGSLVLLGVEIVNVGSICLWCEVVHVLTWVICVFVFRDRKSLVRDERTPMTLQVGVILPLTALVTLWAFLPRYWGAMSYKGVPPFATGTTEDGHPWIGSQKPRLTIHEFIDYRCPHCKVASSQTLRRLARSKDIRIVRRQQPRMRCETVNECKSMRLALCAGEQGKFWQADRYLFEVPDIRKDLDVSESARDLNLDESRLRSCMESPETLALSARLSKEARKLKIFGTPGYIVDGKRLGPDEVMKLF